MPPAPDRLPPHDTASELAVIGCQISEPTTIGETQLRINGDVTAFYDLRNQTIQAAIFELWDAQKQVDLITVQSKLKDNGTLDQIGGIQYLTDAQNAAFSTANLSSWLDIVVEKNLLRRAIRTATKFVGEAFESSESAESMIDRLERDVLALRTMRGNNDIKPIKTLVNEALVDIESMFTRQGQISGISTGLADLDKETDGLHPSEVTLIAAFPSVGKTSLAMNIAEHVAIELGMPVGVFSAEMSGRSLVTRAICSRGRINLRDVRDGRLAEGDFAKIARASTQIGDSHLHIDETSDLTTPQLRAKARRMVQQHGVKLFIADYAQLFSNPGAENRTNELDQVSKGFKNMAKELNVPVILLSQLTEDQKGNVHLKGARAFGEDADNYWLLKRPKDAGEPNDYSEPIELWIKKQRNGPRNVCINLTFLKTITRFESATREMPEFNDPMADAR